MRGDVRSTPAPDPDSFYIPPHHARIPDSPDNEAEALMCHSKLIQRSETEYAYGIYLAGFCFSDGDTVAQERCDWGEP